MGCLSVKKIAYNKNSQMSTEIEKNNEKIKNKEKHNEIHKRKNKKPQKPWKKCRE